MIQFRRGSTESWKKLKRPLAEGQPGYDKDKHKIKVGNGVSLWDKLPYASLSEEEVFDSEENAKKRLIEDSESMAIITYGTDDPDKNTVGQLYLQEYTSVPEVDYVIETGGIDQGWRYQKWNSGIAECWCTKSITTSINTTLTDSETPAVYYSDTYMSAINYPVDFVNPPVENVTVQSDAEGVWLATVSKNSSKQTASYRLMYPAQLTSNTYTLSISVRGSWK